MTPDPLRHRVAPGEGGLGGEAVLQVVEPLDEDEVREAGLDPAELDAV